MELELGYSDKINIIQVGVCDGMIDDPIYRFINSHLDRTNVLLIEPQKDLHALIRSNYKNHNSYKLCEALVGPKGTTKHFSIKPNYWELLNIPYARNLPLYRAPLGVTSTERSHLINFLKLYFNGNPSDAIEERMVEALPLLDIVSLTEFYGIIHLLQIDTEGSDDIVLYNSNIEMLKPRIINFESCNLPKDRVDALLNYLIARGYVIGDSTNDTMAILRSDYQGEKTE